MLELIDSALDVEVAEGFQDPWSARWTRSRTSYLLYGLLCNPRTPRDGSYQASRYVRRRREAPRTMVTKVSPANRHSIRAFGTWVGLL